MFYGRFNLRKSFSLEYNYKFSPAEFTRIRINSGFDRIGTIDKSDSTIPPYLFRHQPHSSLKSFNLKYFYKILIEYIHN